MKRHLHVKFWHHRWPYREKSSATSMNVRPKNSTTKLFFWTSKEATELTENITVMPCLGHIAVLHSVLMFRQLSYFWYMDKLNKHAGGKNVIIPCTNSLMMISLSKNPQNNQTKKAKPPTICISCLKETRIYTEDTGPPYDQHIWHDTSKVWNLEGWAELLLEFLLLFTH